MRKLDTFIKTLLGTALVAAFVPAHAVVLSATNLHGNGYTDYSGAGLLSLDVNASNNAPLEFTLSFSAAEIASGSVSFNAVLNNLIGLGIADVVLDFGALDVTAGSAWSAFDSTAKGRFVATGTAGEYLVGSATDKLEYFGVVIGNPYVDAISTDWTIGTAGLNVDTRYAFSVQAVPEPGSLALLVGGLAMLGTVGRRARRR